MSFKLQIPNPCSEDWDKMNATPNGKHCDLCHKDLVDFRHLSNQQIFNIANVNHKVCGLFSEKQLQTEFQLPKQYTFPKVGLAVSFVSLLAFVNPVKAQQPPGQKQTEPVSIVEQNHLNPQVKVSVQNDTIIIKGKVSDKHTLEPLPFSTIRLKNNKQIGALSDFDGNFTITIPKVELDSALFLTVSLMGFKSVDVEITNHTHHVELFLDVNVFLGDVVIISKKSSRKQKFFNFFRRKKNKKYSYNCR